MVRPPPGNHHQTRTEMSDSEPTGTGPGLPVGSPGPGARPGTLARAWGHGGSLRAEALFESGRLGGCRQGIDSHSESRRLRLTQAQSPSYRATQGRELECRELEESLKATNLVVLCNCRACRQVGPARLARPWAAAAGPYYGSCWRRPGPPAPTEVPAAAAPRPGQQEAAEHYLGGRPAQRQAARQTS